MRFPYIFLLILAVLAGNVHSQNIVTPASFAIWYPPSVKEYGSFEGPPASGPSAMPALTMGKFYTLVIQFYLVYPETCIGLIVPPLNPTWFPLPDSILNETITAIDSFEFGDFLYVFYEYSVTIRVPWPEEESNLRGLSCTFHAGPTQSHSYGFKGIW